uniref:Uncharacterized protein n=1 Tax=Timema tahoe TaxID=61484 RepID=A0A7R9IFV8_9NEOP|nr:unnamed protein product [Timema tahoe]
MAGRSRDAQPLPPNGGWGWFIVLAYSISSTVMGAIIQSFTLLYKDTFTELHMSTTKIAVVANTNIALGLVSALGAGLVCPTTLMALRGYFSSRQGTAMRVAVRMAGVGPILLPPLVAFLMDRYGVQGATLVVGAVSLHCLLGAVLLRPLKWHLKTRDQDVEEGHQHKPVGDISEHDVADEMRRRGTIVPIMKIDAPEDDDQNEGTKDLQQDHHDSDGSRPTSASRGSFADPSGNLDLPGYQGERHASIDGVSLQSSGSRRGSNVWWSKLSMGSVYSASSGRLYDMRAVQVAGGKEDDSDYSSDDGEEDDKEKKRSRRKNSSQPQRRDTIAMTPGSLDVPENSYHTGKRNSSASIKSGQEKWWSRMSVGSIYAGSSPRIFATRVVQVAEGETDEDYEDDPVEEEQSKDDINNDQGRKSKKPQRRDSMETPQSNSLDVPGTGFNTGAIPTSWIQECPDTEYFIMTDDIFELSLRKSRIALDIIKFRSSGTRKRHSSASIKSGQEKWWSRMSVGSIYAGSSSRIFATRVLQVAEGETDEEEEQGIELDALNDKYSSSQDKQNTEDIHPNTLEVPDMSKRAGRRHSSSVSTSSGLGSKSVSCYMFLGRRHSSSVSTRSGLGSKSVSCYMFLGRRHSSSVSTRSGQAAEMWWSKPSSGSINSGSSIRLYEGENREEEDRINKSGEIDYSYEEGERNITEKLLPQRRGTVADVPSTQLNVPNSDRMKDKRNASVTSIKSSGSGYLTAAQSLRTSRSQGSGVWWSAFSLSSVYSTSGTRLSDMRVILPAAKVDDDHDEYDDQISEDEEQDEGDEQIAEDGDSDRHRTEPLKQDRMQIKINGNNSEAIIMNGFLDEEDYEEHNAKGSTIGNTKGRDELKAKTEYPSEISLRELEPTNVSVQRLGVTNELPSNMIGKEHATDVSEKKSDRIFADGILSDTNLKQNHIEVKSDISSIPSVPNDKISSTKGLYPHLDVKVRSLDERIDVKSKDESYDENIASKNAKDIYEGRAAKTSLITVDIEGFPDKTKNDGTYDKVDKLTSRVNEQVGIKEVYDSICGPDDLESTPLIEALGPSNYNEITISIPENSFQTEALLERNNGAKNGWTQSNQIEKIPRLDLNPLRDPSFVNLILGLAISSCADTNFSFLIPLLLGDLDLNNEKIAFIMSVIACADITARFVAPSLAGMGKFSDRTMYLVGLVLLVISRTCKIVTYYTSFKELLWVGAAIGLSRGVKNTYDPTIIPLDTLPTTLVLQMVSTGVIYFILGPLVGKTSARVTYNCPVSFVEDKVDLNCRWSPHTTHCDDPRYTNARLTDPSVDLPTHSLVIPPTPGSASPDALVHPLKTQCIEDRHRTGHPRVTTAAQDRSLHADLHVEASKFHGQGSEK